MRSTSVPFWRLHVLKEADFAVAALLLAAAVLVRLPLLLRGQTLLRPDEAVVGIMAQDIAAGRRLPVYFYGQRYMGALEAYAVAGLMQLCSDQIFALRLAPCLFFAALVALQYLLCLRWFGWSSGAAAALTLLLASPMFAQWSVSARGAYIETLFCGTLLWWLWTEWFATGRNAGPYRQFCLGTLAGFALWLNLMIVVFLLPVAVWHLFQRLPAREQLGVQGPGRGGVIARCLTGLGPFALPALLLAGYLIVTAVFAVEANGSRATPRVLLGLVPPAAAVPVLAGVALSLLLAARRQLGRLRSLLATCPWLVFGAVAGYAPALIYLVQRAFWHEPLEHCLPLGLRPPWTLWQPVRYLAAGLPTLFGADAASFLALATFGWPVQLKRLPAWLAATESFLPALSVASLLVLLAVACWRLRAELAAILCLKRLAISPGSFLLIAIGGLFGLYITNVSIVDFTNIRYLLPGWAILPGLVASCVGRPASVSREACSTGDKWINSGGPIERPNAAQRAHAVPGPIETTGRPGSDRSLIRLAWLAAACLWAACAASQAAMVWQIGPAHPLQQVAKALRDYAGRQLVAEAHDARYLSFFTRQLPAVIEYRALWPRLAHYRSGGWSGMPLLYIVRAERADWLSRWYALGLPGPPPPDASDNLSEALRQIRPLHLLRRISLPNGYELCELAEPLAETF